MRLSATDNTTHHPRKPKARMHQLIGHLCEDIEEITEPKAQAMFETSTEVLNGPVKAFDDHEDKDEEAWWPA